MKKTPKQGMIFLRGAAILTIIIAVFLFVSCGGTMPEKPPLPELPSTTWIVHDTEITRFHDDAKGVTCWIAKHVRLDSPKSISCIADTQIKY